MMEVMQKDFNEHPMMRVTIAENQLGSVQILRNKESPVPQQTPEWEPRPALRSIQNVQNSSAARQLSN